MAPVIPELDLIEILADRTPARNGSNVVRLSSEVAA